MTNEKPAPFVAMRRQTMGAEVADELRRRIMGGELAEGYQLRQEQLAAEFGISKVPVREALNLLEAEGLVVQKFHKGAVVAGISLEQIWQTFELRALVEVWLVRLAMAQATAEDVAAVRACAADLESTAEPSTLPELNWRFHEALYRPAGKDYALDAVHKMHQQFERFVRLQFRIAVPIDQVLAEHAEILRLYERKDPAVETALQTHIMDSVRRLASRMDELGRRDDGTKAP